MDVRLGSSPVVPNTIQALMAVSRELRSFVSSLSSCLSELQVAIAGGMAILSWEAQSVERSTADHSTGFANRISRIWTEAALRDCWRCWYFQAHNDLTKEHPQHAVSR